MPTALSVEVLTYATSIFVHDDDDYDDHDDSRSSFVNGNIVLMWNGYAIPRGCDRLRRSSMWLKF